MFLAVDERQQIARLFAFLLQGERLALDCTSQQATLFNDKASRKFLSNQARQEKFHCQVFKAGIGIVAPRGVSNIPGGKEMQAYRRLLTEAWEWGNQAETLLGMQIILEGLGDVAIRHINAGFELRKVGSMRRRVRYLILAQEDAHHAFGLQRFKASIGDEFVPDYLIQRSQDYLNLLESLMSSVSDLFFHFDEQAEQYTKEFYADLPTWLIDQRS